MPPSSDVCRRADRSCHTQAADTDLAQQRAQMEHAIAVLTGAPPADLPLPGAPGP